MDPQTFKKIWQKEYPEIEKLVTQYGKLYPEEERKKLVKTKQQIKFNEWFTKMIAENKSMLERCTALEFAYLTDTPEYKKLTKKIDDDQAMMGFRMMKQLKRDMKRAIALKMD